MGPYLVLRANFWVGRFCRAKGSVLEEVGWGGRMTSTARRDRTKMTGPLMTGG